MLFALFYFNDNPDWMRIGAFFFDSSEAFLTEKLICPTKLVRNEKLEKVLQSFGSCVLSNIKNGIWIAGTLYLTVLLCKTRSRTHAHTHTRYLV